MATLRQAYTEKENEVNRLRLVPHVVEIGKKDLFPTLMDCQMCDKVPRTRTNCAFVGGMSAVVSATLLHRCILPQLT